MSLAATPHSGESKQQLRPIIRLLSRKHQFVGTGDTHPSPVEKPRHRTVRCGGVQVDSCSVRDRVKSRLEEMFRGADVQRRERAKLAGSPARLDHQKSGLLKQQPAAPDSRRQQSIAPVAPGQTIYAAHRGGRISGVLFRDLSSVSPPPEAAPADNGIDTGETMFFVQRLALILRRSARRSLLRPLCNASRAFLKRASPIPLPRYCSATIRLPIQPLRSCCSDVTKATPSPSLSRTQKHPCGNAGQQKFELPRFGHPLFRGSQLQKSRRYHPVRNGSIIMVSDRPPRQWSCSDPGRSARWHRPGTVCSGQTGR